MAVQEHETGGSGSGSQLPASSGNPTKVLAKSLNEQKGGRDLWAYTTTAAEATGGWTAVRITSGGGNCGPYTGVKVKKGPGAGCNWITDDAGSGSGVSTSVTISVINRHPSAPASAPDIKPGQVVLARPLTSGNGQWECTAPGSELYAREPSDGYATDGTGIFNDADRNGFCYVDDVTLTCSAGGLTVTLIKKFADFRKTKARDLVFIVEQRDCLAP